MDESSNANGLSAALSFLYDRIDYERNAPLPTCWQGLHLDRTRALLERLGNPHQELKIVHVAGTKGKGSTASMIASILVQAKYHVGLYTSPHLQRLEERFVVDHQPCSQQQLIDLIERVRPAVADLDSQRAADDYGLTFFEITTAMAFLHFQLSGVDVAVVEVGMGGRLDSTNVCEPLISVITSISFDHMRQLGNTLAAIATEKAGIIKPRIPVVSGVVPSEPRDAIAQVAQSNGSPLYTLGRDFHFDFTPPELRDANSRPEGRLEYTEVVASSDAHCEPLALTLSPGLLGRHQAANAAVAVATIGRMRSLGWEVTERAIVDGIAGARCPARIEVMAERPWVIVDTAHNAASIEALIAVLRESFAAKRRVLIFAATRDKDALGMLQLLLPHFDSVILTQYHNNPRSMRPADLRQLVARVAFGSTSQARAAPTVSIAPDPLAAWQRCRREIDAESLVCVTGSFFLAAELRGVWSGKDAESARS